ncbi:MAG: hypothetical protein SWX82_14870 [Cyanobacteriota bacterium]|nr:hypothetical protein [Cyanobacteriota bacterium]
MFSYSPSSHLFILKKEEGRRKKEEGRRKKEEYRVFSFLISSG